MRILIADDDPMWRKVLDHHLRGWGYDVLMADDGAQAWAMLQRDDAPRVAILDWQMPNMDGLEVCRRLKKSTAIPFVYTIMLTSRDTEEDEMTGLEAGADSYLPKPVNHKLLRTHLSVAKRIIEAVPPQEWSKPRIPGHDVVRRIGKGAAGSVWEAVQDGTKNRVAVKIVRADLVTQEELMRFAREIEITKRLNHPNVARVFDSMVSDMLCYYTMELIDGKDIGKYVAEEQPPVANVLMLMTKVCDAVAHAHHRGIVHRDLKPANILVGRDIEPKVVDFGLAKSTLRADQEQDPSSTMQGVALGTPLFMAPEQARGYNDQVDARTDVYTLGVILYMLLVRHHPHKVDRSSNMQILRSISEGAARPLRAFDPGISPLLEKIVMKALEPEQAQRYPDAGHLCSDLHRFIATSVQ